MKKLFYPIFTLLASGFLWSCGGSSTDATDQANVPVVEKIAGVSVETILTTNLDYQKVPVDRLDALVYDLEDFWIYTKFNEIPPGEHVFQYTFWQKGQKYIFSPTVQEMSGDGLEQMEEAMNETQIYLTGNFNFVVQDQKNQNVWNKFKTSSAFSYGAGEYFYDSYLDGKLIDRKTIKVLTEEEKLSGTYAPYWLSKELYPQFSGSENIPIDQNWNISYFQYMEKPIVQVIVVPYQSFNKFFAVVTGDGNYGLYEITKQEKKLLREFDTYDGTEVRFHTHLDGNNLYFYNGYKKFNTLLDLSSGIAAKAMELPVPEAKIGQFPSVGGGKQASRTCSGEISVSNQKVFEYKSFGKCGWISWNNKSNKIFFDADGIYEYNLTTQASRKLIYNPMASAPVYFSNNGMDFIAYASGNEVMLATNQTESPSGSYFGSEYKYDNQIALPCVTVDYHDTIEVNYLGPDNNQKLLSEQASMEMEGFLTVVWKVGTVASGRYAGMDVLRFELEDLTDMKGSPEPYMGGHFCYGLSSKDSLIFLDKMLVKQNMAQPIVFKNNQMEISDPGFALTKHDFFKNKKTIAFDKSSTILKLEVNPTLNTNLGEYKLVAAGPDAMVEWKNCEMYTTAGKTAVYIVKGKDDGSFHVYRKDGSHLVYSYDFTGEIRTQGITLNINEYVPYTDRTCDGAKTDLACVVILPSSELRQIGKYAGHNIFELKDNTHEQLKKDYEQYTSGKEEFGNGDEKTMSFDEFMRINPVFFWHDYGDRYVRFIRTDVLKPLMCEPIMYIYPENEQQISIQLGDVVDVIASYPEYNNGWQLHAFKDGSLHDLNSPFKKHRLFWEGKSVQIPVLQKGFVVKRENVNEFLSEKLTFLGLNAMETEEFKEAWMPQLLEKEYCFIGFYDKKAIDRYAPVSISPEPDQFIRILMDFKPLDRPVETEIPTLTKAPVRSGYTVVEWGGLKR